MAAPGKAKNTTIQTIKELDQSVQYALPAAKDDEAIDLSLLITSLLPMEKVRVCRYGANRKAFEPTTPSLILTLSVSPTPATSDLPRPHSLATSP